MCHRVQLQCPFRRAGSTWFHQEGVSACLTAMQETDGLPFICMRNQVPSILTTCPQQSKHYSETSFAPLQKVYLRYFLIA